MGIIKMFQYREDLRGRYAGYCVGLCVGLIYCGILYFVRLWYKGFKRLGLWLGLR